MVQRDKLYNLLKRNSLVYFFITLTLLPLFIFGCQSGEESPSAKESIYPDSTTHYRVDAEIKPASGQFEVSIDMRFVPDESTDTLQFLLHDSFKLDELKGQAVENYSTSPWRFGGKDTVHTKIITVALARTANPSDPVSLTWKYGGQLRNEQIPAIGGAVVSEHWTELPFEAIWIPQEASIGHRFTFEATIDLPENYELVSTGKLAETAEGWHIQSAIPGPDLPLVISDQMQKREFSKGSLPVTVYHGGAPDSLTTFVAERAGQILDRYAGRFQGGSETDELRITVAPVERATSSSYARTGFIALKHGIEPNMSLYELIAHEAAHLWWTDSVNPMSRHNFLNESFAEHEAWLALQEAYGDSVYQERLAKARKNAQKAPSFYDWKPRFDGALSYNKGPVLLHELHQRIGESDYRVFVEKLQEKNVGTLGGMIAVLGEVADAETSSWFEEKL